MVHVKYGVRIERGISVSSVQSWFSFYFFISVFPFQYPFFTTSLLHGVRRSIYKPLTRQETVYDDGDPPVLFPPAMVSVGPCHEYDTGLAFPDYSLAFVILCLFYCCRCFEVSYKKMFPSQRRVFFLSSKAMVPGSCRT